MLYSLFSNLKCAAFCLFLILWPRFISRNLLLHHQPQPPQHWWSLVRNPWSRNLEFQPECPFVLTQISKPKKPFYAASVFFPIMRRQLERLKKLIRHYPDSQLVREPRIIDKKLREQFWMSCHPCGNERAKYCPKNIQTSCPKLPRQFLDNFFHKISKKEITFLDKILDKKLYFCHVYGRNSDRNLTKIGQKLYLCHV